MEKQIETQSHCHDNDHAESYIANIGVTTNLDSSTQEDVLNELLDATSYVEDATLQITFTKADYNHQERHHHENQSKNGDDEINKKDQC